MITNIFKSILHEQDSKCYKTIYWYVVFQSYDFPIKFSLRKFCDDVIPYIKYDKTHGVLNTLLYTYFTDTFHPKTFVVNNKLGNLPLNMFLVLDYLA